MEPTKQNNTSKILIVLVILVVVMGSLFLVFRNIQKPLSSSNNQSSESASTPKEDLIASNDIKSVDQVEADNLADDVALDPNQ